MTGVRFTMFGLVVVPSGFTSTFVVLSGSTSSKSRPALPFSSPNRIVPHEVRRTGSQDVSPLFTIVELVPSLSLIATTPTWPEPCSLQPMTCVGAVSFGHKAIWSRFAHWPPARRSERTVLWPR